MIFSDLLIYLIWSEGAIYNIGFEKGIRQWKNFLKKDGYMVLTEITWLKKDLPEETKKHWNTEIVLATESILLEKFRFKKYDPLIL
jgi:hypothetical protein